MNGIRSVLILTFFLPVIFVNSQSSSLPAIDIYTLDGAMIKASEISNDGNVMIVVFWKTYDKDGSNQVIMLNEVHQERLLAKDVKFVAICVDCIGRTDHVKPIVYGQDIEMEVYIDKNGDLSRAMSITRTPYTVMFDKQMNVHCKYAGYCANGDEMLCRKIEACMAEIEAVQ